jgi:hypothetical protein
MTNERENRDPLVEKLKQQIEKAKQEPFVDHIGLQKSAPLLLPIISEMVDDSDGLIFLTDLDKRVMPAYDYSSSRAAEIGEIVAKQGKEYGLRREAHREAVKRVYPGDEYHFKTTGRWRGRAHNAVIIFKDRSKVNKYIKKHTVSVNSRTVVDVEMDI